MPPSTPTATIADKLRGGWRIYFHCDNCGRYRVLQPVEIARKVGWDYDYAKLQAVVSCAKCRVRGRLTESHCGSPEWVCRDRGDKTIQEHPFRTVVRGPWKARG